MAIPSKEQMTGSDTTEAQFKSGMNNIVDFLGEVEKQSLVLDSADQLRLFRPAIGKRAKTLDSGKVWEWNGWNWDDTGEGELELAKDYTNSIVKNVETLNSGTDIRNITEIKHYLLPKNSIFEGLPAGFDLSKASATMQVMPETGAYVSQHLSYLDEPFKVWTKTLHKNNGTGVWFEPFYEYQGVFDGIDPTSLSNIGRYVLTNAVNVPEKATGTLALDIKKNGGLITRRITMRSNLMFQWEKADSGVWTAVTPFDLNVKNLSRDFSYRGHFVNGDLNNMLDGGQYLVSGNVLNNPSWVTGTQYVDVHVYGSFLIQVTRSVQTMNQIAQRRINVSSAGVSTLEWEKVGGGSSENTSSLNGKSIAFIGDSIVEGGNYPELIGEQYGATIHKFGFGGCRASYYPTNTLGYNLQCLWNIAKCINSGDYSSLISGAEYTRDNHSDNNVPQATAMSTLDWSKVDILCIAFGTNDWTSQNGLGSDLVADSEGKTYKGALCYAVEQIQSKYPHLQIVLIGMSFRLRLSSTPEKNSDNTANDLGEYLDHYQQALIDVGEKYHIPVFDMYRNSGLNSMNYSHYLQDAVHPKNGVGYQHWASKIGSFLISNF